MSNCQLCSVLSSILGMIFNQMDQFFILIHNNKSFIYRQNSLKIIQSKQEFHHSLIIFQYIPFIIFYTIYQNCSNSFMFIPIICSNFIGSRKLLPFYALNGWLDVDIEYGRDSWNHHYGNIHCNINYIHSSGFATDSEFILFCLDGHCDIICIGEF